MQAQPKLSKIVKVSQSVSGGDLRNTKVIPSIGLISSNVKPTIHPCTFQLTI